jgi:hypothetical protein
LAGGELLRSLADEDGDTTQLFRLRDATLIVSTWTGETRVAVKAETLGGVAFAVAAVTWKECDSTGRASSVA